MEGFDMRCEVLAVFEVELVLRALFSRAAGDVAGRSRVAQNRSAKLLVYQDAGL
jgi:hypothetical protein